MAGSFPRRFIRFGIRSLFLAIAIVAIASAWTRHQLDKTKAETDVLAELDQARVEVIAWKTIPKWAQMLLPKSAALRFERVTSLVVVDGWLFGGKNFGDAECAKLQCFDQLRELHVFGTGITERSQPIFFGFKNLQVLDVRMTKVGFYPLRERMKELVPHCTVLDHERTVRN